ncbi:MAG TPA: BON domain-containing protein [Pyrinomonadaceae bacterium]|jgi:osmotically-inducible protein OsmY
MKRDSEVEQLVLRSLKLDSAIVSNEICVESHGGVVTLRGIVLNRFEKSAIYSAARQSPGVCRVVNKVEVKRGRLTIPEHSKNATRPEQSIAYAREL